MALDFSVRTIIEQKIREIEKEYQQTQGLILTEDDLKCLLYKKLAQIRGLSKRIKTEDTKIHATSIHTEVSWYDDSGKLTIKPDITILEPRHLSILHKYGSSLRLPTKQFSFNGEAIIFELKFIRNKTGITPNTLKMIIKDYDKIQGLFQRLQFQDMPGSVFCYFVVFNKTDIRCPEFDSFMQQHGATITHEIIYATGKVCFK